MAEWFKIKYNKSINQSTVSRNLKRFKASTSPTSKHISGALEASPILKRDHKPNIANSRSPPQKKIQISRNPQHCVPSAISLPPTPPPRETNKKSTIISALNEFFDAFKKANPSASTADCDQALKKEASRLYATLQLQDNLTILIDDEWIAEWKQQRRPVLGSPLSLQYFHGHVYGSGPSSQKLPVLAMLSTEETVETGDLGSLSSEHVLSPMARTGSF